MLKSTFIFLSVLPLSLLAAVKSPDGKLEADFTLSARNRQLSDKGGLIVWVADVPGSKDKYLAVFNTGDASAPVPVELSAVGFSGRVAVRDLWARVTQDNVRDTVAPVAPVVPSHGSALYRLRAR